MNADRKQKQKHIWGRSEISYVISGREYIAKTLIIVPEKA